MLAPPMVKETVVSPIPTGVTLTAEPSDAAVATCWSAVETEPILPSGREAQELAPLRYTSLTTASLASFSDSVTGGASEGTTGSGLPVLIRTSLHMTASVRTSSTMATRVAGEELKLSNLVSVMPKNMATPYTVDEYAVIISTNDPNRPIIQLRVGYDGGLAREIATQIDTHIRI